MKLNTVSILVSLLLNLVIFVQWSKADHTQSHGENSTATAFAIQRVLGPQFLSMYCPGQISQCAESTPTKFFLYPLEDSKAYIIHNGSFAIGASSSRISLQATKAEALKLIYSNTHFHFTLNKDNGFSKFINVATGLALDGNGAGHVYLHPSSPGNHYQNWKLLEWSSIIIDSGPDANWEVPEESSGKRYRLQSNVTKEFVSFRCNQDMKKACAVSQYSHPLLIEFTPVNAEYTEDQRRTPVYIHDINRQDNTSYAIGLSPIHNGSGRIKVEVEHLSLVYPDRLYHWLVVKGVINRRRFVNIATGYTLAIQATEPSVFATSQASNPPLMLIKV